MSWNAFAVGESALPTSLPLATIGSSLLAEGFPAAELESPSSIEVVLKSHLRSAMTAALGRVLEAEGFTGVFPEYVRHQSPVLSMIWVQERSDHSSCCVNLGVHLDFLPATDNARKLPVVEEMTQPRCEIKKRLVPEAGLLDYWWSYADGEKIVDEIVSALADDALPFFRRLSDFPAAWLAFSLESLEDGSLDAAIPGVTRARAALMLARVHHRCGSRRERDRFAEYAVKVAGPMAKRFMRARVAELEAS